MASAKEIADFFPIEKEALLAPVIWGEVFSFAKFDNHQVFIALNNIELGLRFPESEWINPELRAQLDALIAEIVAVIPGVSPLAFDYFADYIDRVVVFYRRNPSFISPEG